MTYPSINKIIIHILCTIDGYVTDISASALSYFDIDISKVKKRKTKIEDFVIFFYIFLPYFNLLYFHLILYL